MPLLSNVVVYEYGERYKLPSRTKLPAEHRAVYIAKQISAEDREILKKYYLHKRSRFRLQNTSKSLLFPVRARRARRTLEVLADYDKSVICVPWKVWWKDKGNPKHPFSTVQSRVFKSQASGIRDMTGGLAFWISESGRAKNKILHEAIDEILTVYLNDTIPMYERIVRGELIGKTAQNVVEEIMRRADEVAGAIVIAHATYGMSDDPNDSRPNLASLGDNEAKLASAEGYAQAWLSQPPPI